MTRIKHQSEGIKKGNPKDHDKGVANTQAFLHQVNLEEITEWYVSFTEKFNKQNKLRSDYGHSYDLFVYKHKDINSAYPVMDASMFHRNRWGETQYQKPTD